MQKHKGYNQVPHYPPRNRLGTSEREIYLFPFQFQYLGAE